MAAEQTHRRSRRIKLLRLGVDLVDMDGVLAQVDDWVRDGTPGHIVTANVRFMSIAQKDRSFAQVVDSAALSVADGMPLVWLSRLMGTPVPQRITGCDLIHALSQHAADRGYSIFVLGAEPGVAEDAARRLEADHPGLRVAGTHHGYFGDDGEDEVVRYIRQCRPHIMFVGMGSPRQDFWINRLIHELQVPVCIGVGGSFEVITGRLKRAPTWMQRWGLEWSYRFKQEPRRLWRRYVMEDAPTVLRATGSALRTAISARVAPR